MRKKPLIGLSCDFLPQKNRGPSASEATYFLRARYVIAIQEAGGIPLILPPIQGSAALRVLVDGMSGLLITGSGLDLDPALYGERNGFRFKVMDAQRAAFEFALIRLALERDLPFLGICGGMQSFNVVLGGSLFQDIDGQIKKSLPNQPSRQKPKLFHNITLNKGTRLARLLRKTVFRVNSSHHQSVNVLGKGLVVNAVAPDGVIEGIEHPSRCFALGVQWHPEGFHGTDAINQRIFKKFVQAAARTQMD